MPLSAVTAPRRRRPSAQDRRNAAIGELRALIAWGNDLPPDTENEANMLCYVIDRAVKALGAIDPEVDEFLDTEEVRPQTARRPIREVCADIAF